MKTRLLLSVLAATVLLAGCKKDVDDMEFSGKAIGCLECTGQTAKISEIDYGYIVELTKPEGYGSEYYDASQQKHSNVVILYGTRTLIKDGTVLEGRMYEDEDYSRSYCSIRYKSLGLKEMVCSELD